MVVDYDEKSNQRIPKISLVEYFLHSGQALCVTDAYGIVVYVNDSYCYITGIDKNTCIGKPEPFDDAIAKKVGQTGQAIIRTRHFVNTTLPGGRYIMAIPVEDAETRMRYVVLTVESDNMINRRYLAMEQEKLRAESTVRYYNKSKEVEQLPELLGNSIAIEKVKSLIRRVSSTSATVLITGESGSGKEVIADSIQRLSNRKDKPYIKINCAALPANLLESELFGYEKGAFTGASTKGKTGLFEVANGGTLFLDEIGDFPLELQPKLLRVLQNKEFYRVGGNTTLKVDVRIIAATNSNLLEKVESGVFREDLFYRLSIFPIHAPSLRERPEDIELLINLFLARCCKEYNRTIEMSPTIMNILKRYKWPGNVRELQNVVEYYVICSDEEEEMSISALQSILRQPDQILDIENSEKDFYQIREEFERNLLIETLNSSKGVREAASKLHLSLATMYRKLQQYHILEEL